MATWFWLCREGLRSYRQRYAALSDTGLARESNQDTAYAGTRLLAVADGYGSQRAPASAAAVDAFKHLETDSIPAGNLLNVLEDAIEQAKQAVHGVAGAGSSPVTADTRPGPRSRRRPRHAAA